MSFLKRGKRASAEIFPEEVLLDAHNLPSYDSGRLEGRLIRPIRARALLPLILFLVLAGVLVLGRSAWLMVVQGAHYTLLSERNRLDRSRIIPERGIIYDRKGRELAWNVPAVVNGEYEEYDLRTYATSTGMGHLLGYVRMPARDTQGVFYREAIEGIAGVEEAYDTYLRGKEGERVVETDARMEVLSDNTVNPALPGEAVRLTVDSDLTSILYEMIHTVADEVPFTGGAGVIMDVKTGEILALTSYPEYESSALATGDAKKLAFYGSAENAPYLNRVLAGQFTPGSIVKPYLAVAALNEGIIQPSTSFVSTGALRLANPYMPGTYSVFTDWRAHGAVDLQRALAVSSNVYFYYIGGGFGGQEGLGITRIERYLRMFGFGSPTGIALGGEVSGVLPSPAWKAETFPDDPTWRIGDTYHTSIGQYGTLVTPLQMVRAVAALVNGGRLLTPRVETVYTPYEERGVDVPSDDLLIVRGGMRAAVLEGIAAGLNTPYLAVAAKTGTAEVGTEKGFVHSWVTGYFPYEKPKYAFVVLMEHGPCGNLLGATYVMRQFFDVLHAQDSTYLKEEG